MTVRTHPKTHNGRQRVDRALEHHAGSGSGQVKHVRFLLSVHPDARWLYVIRDALWRGRIRGVTGVANLLFGRGRADPIASHVDETALMQPYRLQRRNRT